MRSSSPQVTAGEKRVQAEKAKRVACPDGTGGGLPMSVSYSGAESSLCFGTSRDSRLVFPILQREASAALWRNFPMTTWSLSDAKMAYGLRLHRQKRAVGECGVGNFMTGRLFSPANVANLQRIKCLFLPVSATGKDARSRASVHV